MDESTEKTITETDTEARDGVNLDELQQETEKLLTLLKERKPEQGSWHQGLNDGLEAMSKFARQALEARPNRRRIQLDFSIPGYKKLLSLVQESGHKSYVDVIRASLALYDWYRTHRAEGYAMVREKEGVRREVEFKGF